MPWNFPFWQVFRFAAPAWMAGNVCLLKHAPNTPQCALAIEELVKEAGFLEGCLLCVFADNDQAAKMIADLRVAGVTLTGSTRAGQLVASVSGHHLKPMVMELGGSDPLIVFPDADLPKAIAVGVQSRCLNNGQSCIAAKRFLLHKDIFHEFANGFVAAMCSRKMGDPRDQSVQLGPLARFDLREALHRQVEESIQAGAKCLCGGSIPSGKGFFYPATVLSEVPADCVAGREELFGPVAPLIAFANEEEALQIANRTEYGLAASVWTQDRARMSRMLEQLDAGGVFVNGLVKSDPRLPFGGIKRSGFGRELAREGLMSFVNKKTVWIA